MQTPLKGKRGSQHGLTLIELLVAMIIMTVVSTMLVGGWISLQNSFAFTQRTNEARATARDALDRISSELRDAQPPASTATPPKFTGTTPFYLPATPTYPYMCGPTSCVFYSAYNNSAAADGTGMTQQRLTAIWLDTSGSTEQKTLWWQRDTNGNGFEAGDRKIKLATNVVNTAASVNKPIFIYYFRDSAGIYSNSYTGTITPFTGTSAANLSSVRIELVIDVNLAHTPSYVDLMTTVRPRNANVTN